MPAFAASSAPGETLSHWLRLLFDRAPPLRFDSEVPFIAAGMVHLPPQRTHWSYASAAAAHAAAHLVYSPAGFGGTGLGPIARALVGALEDARVEALATRELPGLGRLWQSLYTATPALGASFEALLQRLARALADPAYDDTDAWVRKGCTLFFFDKRLGVAALRTPAEVRHAAMQLGHDIGQMRLQHDGKNYRPAPDYRDDHRWMWAADMLQSEPPPGGATVAGGREDAEPPSWIDAEVTLYPEWDRLISRLRLDWSRILERQAGAADATAATAKTAETEPLDARLCETLRALAGEAGASSRSDEGESFDLSALVDWRVARRMRTTGDRRVFCAAADRYAPTLAWLLIDRSASTAAAFDDRGTSVLQAAIRGAASTSRALESIGASCAVAAFASKGRHAVDVDTLKPFEHPLDGIVAARLGALRPGGSTRLGAALRHATHRLATRGRGPRWIIVFSDGEPHDIDVHDARYLVEDARHAVLSAARQGVRIVCVALDAHRASDALRIFGAGGVCLLKDMRSLAQAFRRLSR